MPRCFPLSLLLAALMLVAAAGLSCAADAEGVLTDEQFLRTAGLSSDGPALLEFFRIRTLAEADREKVAVLIGKLGSRLPGERDRATAELLALGITVSPLLRQATRDPDAPEIAAGARRCLQFLEGNQVASLPAVAARLLAQKRPPGASQVLLDYLPFADDDTVLEEVKTALAGLLEGDGSAMSIFLRTLNDPSPLRRVIVAEILCKAGGKDVLPTVRKLLLDPRPVVRLRAALALAAVKDVDAISTLIALLAELPPVLGRQAEEFLVNLAADQAPKVPLADNEASRKACHDAWASWWQGTEGLASLQEFRKRTLTEADREKVQVLIKQLGDEDFGVRQRASLALDGYSNSIAPLLRQALTSDDEEIKKRVRNCLDKIDKEKSAPLLSVQARLVAFRKPERAVEVLLAFLPFADDEATLDEVRAALAAVAVRDGMPDPAIVKGMEDKLPLRRGIAAEALALGGATDQRPALRKMLQDSDPNVRLRVALALATVHDREAVPVLIDLLGDLPSSSGTQAELFLRGLVGEQAPTVYLSTDDASRQKVKEAWAAWWKDNGAAVDMNRPISGPRLLGYTLLIATDFNRIVEVGLDGKERWNLDNLQYPRDAQVLPGDRILIAEQGIHRVAEWNSRREILWHKQVNGPPVSCQRLANGNTGITMANGLLEVDRNGKDVFTYQRPQHDIMCGSRGSDGQWVFITHACQVIRVDSTGKEIKSFSTGGGQVPWSIELLPNSRILMPLPGHNRVVEYDSDGKIVWEVAVQNPFSAQRLSNGNTLVASPQLMKVFELNRGGRVVWEHTAAQMDRPQRARRR